MKQNKGKIIISTLATLLPMAMGLVLWNKLPDQVPTHFNFSGVADGYSSKGFAVFGLYGIMAALHLVCLFAVNADPKNKGQNPKPMEMIYWVVPVVSVLTGLLVYGTALGYSFSITLWMQVLVGVLFLVTGNYMPKTKQNYTMGVKVSWTLNSQENWDRTHRFAGRLWVVLGLVILAACFLPEPVQYGVLMVAPLLGAIAPIVYSYLLYRKGI